MFLQLAHTRLPIYSESQKLALECYRITKLFPADERYAMVQQIRRAALSVHLNISEGSSRKSEAERKRYYEIARGSVIEIDAALDIAFQLNYCDMEALKLLGELIVICFKQLSGIIASNSKSN